MALISEKLCLRALRCAGIAQNGSRSSHSELGAIPGLGINPERWQPS